MSDLQVQFEDTVKEVQKLAKRPSNDELLKLYALYKQSSVGDVFGKRPGITDFKGRAKYDAWSKQKGVSKEEAMQSYIGFVHALKEKLGFRE